MAHLGLLAALSWDPQVRGAAIVLAAIVILPGSVYLLLATNMGARLGFILAVTGLAGWMVVMGAIWMVFGIGLKGKEPEWRVEDAVTGEVAQSTVPAVSGFPRGWHKLEEGNPELADAQTAAERVLVPGGGESGGEGGGEGGGGGGGGEGGGGEGGEGGGGSVSEQAQRFDSPFNSAEEFETVGGYRKGGETYFLTLRHRPHYAIYQVRPKAAAPAGGAMTQSAGSPSPGGTTPQPTPGQPPSVGTPSPGAESPSGPLPAPGTGSSATPQATTPGPGGTQAPPGTPAPPLTSVIMVRDLGNLRFPPFLVMVTSLLIFGVCCYSLHQRDKEILRARSET